MSHIFRNALLRAGASPPVRDEARDGRPPRSCKPFALSHYHRTVHVPDGFIDAPTSAVTGLVAAGAIAAWMLARSFNGVLFGVASATTMTLIGAAMLLIAVAGAASVIPARRAARIDPIRALRID